jgi:hypothetical protein
MSEYDRSKVDAWLASLPDDPAQLNIVALAVTSPEVSDQLLTYFHMSTWERANALYGLARRTEGHVRACAQTMALAARDEDREAEE